MAVKRPQGLSDDPSTISAVRTLAGVIVADNTTLSDANYPVVADTTGPGVIPVNDPAHGGVVSAGRWKSIFLGIVAGDGTELGGGVTLDIEALVFDRFGDTDHHWRRMLDAAGNPVKVTLSNAGLVEFPVNGRTVFLRIDAVGGAPAAGIQILAFPGAGVLS